MVEEISALEKISAGLEPDRLTRQEILFQTNQYTNNFIDDLPQMQGFLPEGQLHLPQIGKPALSFKALLSVFRTASEDGINSASGRHLGFIPGGGLWMSGVGDYVAAITNKYAGVSFSSPGLVKIERAVIEWLTSVVGYPSEAYGDLTSGGSVATLIAIQTARDAHRINSSNVRSSVIYVSRQTHHSTKKAIDTTGLHEAILKIIPVDQYFRMDIVALEQEIESDIENGNNPFLIIASAGTTDTGAVDDLEAIGSISENNNIWFHVDAAYGGFFMLTDEGKLKMRGIERSDSVVIDPHKTLFIPYGSGAVLVRDRKKLLQSFSFKANYLQDVYAEEVIDPADTGPELSRHNRALRIWFPLQYHGIEMFAAALKEKLLLCRYFYEKIAEVGFETGPYPDLSVCIFRYPEGEESTINLKLVEMIQKDGRVYFSSTRLNGKVWLRCAVVSHRTHLQEIDLGLKMLQHLVAKAGCVEITGAIQAE